MKAMVIGLDGATFRVLDPLMKAGFMPNLEEAMGKGARGELLSTVPPVTALAWPSFFTGKNAGKHGLLGWQERLNEDFKRPWISAKKIDGPKLWHVLNQEGFRTCVVNVPVTYPPEPLDGVMVSGMLTPGLQAEFTYPPDLREALLAAVPGYRVDVDVQPRLAARGPHLRRHGPRRGTRRLRGPRLRGGRCATGIVGRRDRC